MTSDVWFILEASHAHRTEAWLSASLAGSQRGYVTISELLSSPFPVFRHVQLAGDLLVIPPRWYVLGIEVARDPDHAVVLHRIFGKDHPFLSRGRACRSTV